MTDEDKQEALNDLMYLAGSLNSLSQAFYQTGNDKVGDQLRFVKLEIIEAVNTIRTVDHEESSKETQRLNQFTATILEATLEKDRKK